MDEIPLCPDWWPLSLWRLHHKLTYPGGFKDPGGAVNYPPILSDVLANLHIHTFTYMMMDQKAYMTRFTHAGSHINSRNPPKNKI